MMPKVHHVKKARKDYPNNGIKKGDSYYHWKFRYGGIRRSKTRPTRSQLTQSEFLSTIWEIEDELQALTYIDESTATDFAERLRELAEEQEEKLYNMPDSLQYAPTGELLQNRADEVNEMADELENLDFDSLEVDMEDVKELYEKEEDETDDEYEERMQEEKESMEEEAMNELLDEVNCMCYNGE